MLVPSDRHLSPRIDTSTIDKSQVLCYCIFWCGRKCSFWWSRFPSATRPELSHGPARLRTRHYGQTVWVPTFVDAVTGEMEGPGRSASGHLPRKRTFSVTAARAWEFLPSILHAQPTHHNSLRLLSVLLPTAHKAPTHSPWLQLPVTLQDQRRWFTAPPLDAKTMERKEVERLMRKAQLDIEEAQLELAKLQRRHGILTGLVVEK